MYRKTLQTSVAAAALFAFAAPFAGPASADETFKTGSKASLTMSGQVNRAFLIADDGNDTEVFHVDNDNSSTRIRWVGKGKVTETFDAGMLIEVQLESNSTADVNIADHETAKKSTNSFGERKMEVWLSYKGLGKLTLGQGDTASNGSAEVSLSGMSPAMYAGIGDTAGGILFRTETLADGLDADGPTIGSVHNQVDGLSRQDRIRYDSPKLAGFVASASHVQGNNWDIALRHSGKFGQFKTSAAIAYAETDGTSATNDSLVDGSFSILHDSGLNVTFSAGNIDDNSRSDTTNFYVMLGYIAKLTNLGTTRFAIDYGATDDDGVDGDEFETIGFGVLQNLKEIGTDIYAVFRNHSLDRPGENFDDVNIFMTGARVRF